MYKVCLLYDVPGWSYQRRTDALERFAPDDFEVEVAGRDALRHVSGENFDLILQLCYGRIQDLRTIMNKRKSRAVLVGGYNVGWGYRPEKLAVLQKHSDHIVFNNLDNWNRCKRPQNTSCIMNGVDREVFSLMTPTGHRVPRVLWTGSEYHNRNNDVKGFQSILMPLKRRLHGAGLTADFRVVNSCGGPTKWSPETMNRWYNTGMIYVNASEVEGAVNPPLEAAACGCVVVSTPVGNMPELIRHGHNGVLVERTVDSVLAGILQARTKYRVMAKQMQRDIAEWDWKVRAEQYYDLFRRVIGSGN